MWEDLAYKWVGDIIPCVWVPGCITVERSVAVAMHASFSLLLTVDVIGYFKVLLL